MHYAAETRAEQDRGVADDPKVGILGVLFPSKKTQHFDETQRRASTLGHEQDMANLGVTDEEWMNAQRAVRQASGAACFYLITTDILGPFGLAYSFATVGWV